MNKSIRFPALCINNKNIYENAKRIVELCLENGIKVSGVIKGANGIMNVAEEFIRAGCAHIASSRMEQLQAIKEYDPDVETMLLRIPMLSEVDDLIDYADISLNSEWETVEKINEACEKHEKFHRVILMLDLGDLREGFFYPQELIDLALHIENYMKNIKLAGVGTNLGCYGSVKPTNKNLGELCKVADDIEKKIGRKLEFVSGGATSSLPLLVSGEMPDGVNNLRIGEGILLNMDLPEIWEVNIEGMKQDTFTLQAEIIEIKEKPSYPCGELFIDAMGNKPTYKDRGIRKKALLAVGKQDFALHDKLIPLDKGVEIVGSSSDHMIIDIQNAEKLYKLGDILEFKMFYGPMLYLCGSEWVRKTYKDK